MVKVTTLKREELISDILEGIRKYKLYFGTILTSLTVLVVYSHINFKLDNEIISLTQEKNYLIATNLKLKKDLAIISSPDKISNIAKKEGKMKSVDYRQVKFLEIK